MKPLAINRMEFLQALESVECGLSPKDALEQSSCFAFKRGRVMCYNNEVYARCSSGLPADFEGAVHGKLCEAVRKLPDDEVRIRIESDELCVEGLRDSSYVHIQPKVVLPVDDVEKPVKGAWKPVEQEFSEGLQLVVESCARDEQEFRITCVHVHPDYVEAADGLTHARFQVATGIKESCLIRAQGMKAVALRGPTECQDTEGWLHYRNGSGVTISTRKYSDEEYWDFSKHLEIRGTPTTLPKGLVQAAERLEVFSKENSDDNVVRVEILRDRVKLEAIGVSGRQTHRSKVKYAGKPVSFKIGLKVLSRLVDQHTEVEIVSMKNVQDASLTALIARAGRLFFLAGTGNPTTKD